MADAADLLDEQVDGFGRSVRCTAGAVVGEDLVSPTIDRSRETGELGDVGVGGVLEEHDQPPSRVCEIDRLVHRLFGFQGGVSPSRSDQLGLPA